MLHVLIRLERMLVWMFGDGRLVKVALAVENSGDLNSIRHCRVVLTCIDFLQTLASVDALAFTSMD